MKLKDRSYKTPGFINFFFNNFFWQKQLEEYLNLNDKFNYKIKKSKKFVLNMFQLTQQD